MTRMTTTMMTTSVSFISADKMVEVVNIDRRATMGAICLQDSFVLALYVVFVKDCH